MTLAARVYCNLIVSNCARKSHLRLGRLPWSSAYERRIMFWRSWVRILALYTGWTFFAFVCCKKIKGCLKRPKINEIEVGDGPFKKSSAFTRLMPMHKPSRPPMVDKNEIQVCLGSLLNWRMGEFSKYTCREHLIGKFWSWKLLRQIYNVGLSGRPGSNPEMLCFDRFLSTLISCSNF